jgi:type II secretory pathway pseudopilin PulG
VVAISLPGYQLSARQQGFSYLGLLFVIALMGATMALTGVVWHAAQKREKERQLLFVGNQYRQAIAAYYNRSPGSVKQYPNTLSDLLKDPRQLVPTRYLRRIYPDPVTGKAEWGLVKTRDNRIMGVFSLSEDEPVKRGGFAGADKEFEGKMRYAEWRFTYNVPQASPQSVAAPAMAATLPPPLSTKPQAEQTPPVSPGAQKPVNESLCGTLLKNDVAVCQIMASKYGEETAKLCAESSEARFTECSEKQTVIGLPPLKIQFDPEKGLPQP